MSGAKAAFNAVPHGIKKQYLRYVPRDTLVTVVTDRVQPVDGSWAILPEGYAGLGRKGDPALPKRSLLFVAVNERVFLRDMLHESLPRRFAMDVPPRVVNGLPRYYSSPVTVMSLSPTGKELAVGYADGSIRLASWGVAGEELELGQDVFQPAQVEFPAFGWRKEADVWPVEVGFRGPLHGSGSEHKTRIRVLQWSLDGSLLASGDDSGHIFLWDADQATRLAHLTGHKGPITSLMFVNPDLEDEATFPSSRSRPLDGNRRLAKRPIGLFSGGSDSAIRLWDVRTGSLIITEICHRRDVSGFHFDHFNGRLLSVGSDGCIYQHEIVIDDENETLVAKFLGCQDRQARLKNKGTMPCQIFSTTAGAKHPNGAVMSPIAAGVYYMKDADCWTAVDIRIRLVIAPLNSNNTPLEIYNIPTLEGCVKAKKKRLKHLKKRMIKREKELIAREEEAAKMREVVLGKNSADSIELQLTLQRIAQRRAEIDEDREEIATDALDCRDVLLFEGAVDVAQRTKVWAVTELPPAHNRSQQWTLHGFTGAAGHGAWRFDKENLVTPFKPMRGADIDPIGVATSTSSSIFCIVGRRTIQTFLYGQDGPEMMSNVPLPRQGDRAICCASDPKGKLLAIGLSNGQVLLYELVSGRLMARSMNEGDKVVGIDVLVVDDEPTIVCVTQSSGTDVTSEARILVYKEVEAEGEEESDDLNAVLVSKTRGRRGEKITVSLNPAERVRWSPNGRYVVVVLKDHTAQVLHADSLRLHLTLTGNKLPIIAIDIDDESRFVVTAGLDKQLRLYELDHGNINRTIRAHQGGLTAVRFLPKTNFLVSGGTDGSIKFWDTDLRDEIQVLQGHNTRIGAISYMEDAGAIVTLGADGDPTARFWVRTSDFFNAEEERNVRAEEETDADLSRQATRRLRTKDAGGTITRGMMGSIERVETSAQDTYDAICEFEVDGDTLKLVKTLDRFWRLMVNIPNADLHDSISALTGSDADKLLEVMRTFFELRSNSENKFSRLAIEGMIRTVHILVSGKTGVYINNPSYKPTVSSLAENISYTTQVEVERIARLRAGLQILRNKNKN